MRRIISHCVVIAAFATPALADVRVEDPARFHRQGILYMQDEQWNLALEQLERSIEVKNDDFRVWIDLGDVLVVDPRGVRYGSDARNARAAEAYRRATELNPGAARAWNNLAWLGAKTKSNLDEALAAAKRAVEIEEGSAGYLDTLGEVHFVRGETGKAIAVIERALELAPGDAYLERQMDRFVSEMAARQSRSPLTPRAPPPKPAGGFSKRPRKAGEGPEKLEKKKESRP